MSRSKRQMQQDAALEKNIIGRLVKAKMRVCIYLVSGISLKGYIMASDDNAILLQPDFAGSADNQLILKRVITTIMLNDDTDKLNKGTQKRR